MTVYYDPRNPANAALRPRQAGPVSWLLLALGPLFPVVAGWALLTPRRAEQREAAHPVFLAQCSGPRQLRPDRFLHRYLPGSTYARSRHTTPIARP